MFDSSKETFFYSRSYRRKIFSHSNYFFSYHSLPPYFLLFWNVYGKNVLFPALHSKFAFIFLSRRKLFLCYFLITRAIYTKIKSFIILCIFFFVLTQSFVCVYMCVCERERHSAGMFSFYCIHIWKKWGKAYTKGINIFTERVWIERI